MSRRSYLFTLLVFFFFSPALGGIYEFNQTPLDYIRAPMWSSSEQPLGQNGPSYIEMNVTFSQQSRTQTTISYVEVVILHHSLKGSLGVEGPSGSRQYCCNAALFNQKRCEVLGRVIQANNENSSLYWYAIEFFNNQSAKLSKRFPISDSGVYYMKIFNCGSSTGIIVLDGEAVFRNPYGYLPGGEFPLLPFFSSLSAVYLVFGCFWLYLSYRYRHNLLPFQYCIGAMFVVVVLELLFGFIYNFNYNSNGKLSIALLIFSVLLNTIKKVASRVLVLVVAMGYTVVKPEIGSTLVKTALILLSVLYVFFSSVTRDLVIITGKTFHDFSDWLLFLSPSVLIIDVIFSVWIIYSLKETLSYLSLHQQPVKFQMYNYICITLIMSLVLAVIFIVLQIIMSLSQYRDNWWKVTWVWEAFWHILYTLVFVVIAFLWRPNPNNSQYSYNQIPEEGNELDIFGEALTDSDEDEEAGKTQQQTYFGSERDEEIIRKRPAQSGGEDEVKKDDLDIAI